MTDPMKGTPLAAFDVPDGMFGLGAGEVAYLLGRHEGPASQRSRALLMLDPRQADQGALLAGASSLVSRGWLTIGDDGGGETRSNAALVEYALGATTRWTRIGLVGDDVSDLDYAVLLESESVLALLQPRQLASWFWRLGDPELDRGDFVTTLVTDRLENRPKGGVFLEVQTLHASTNLAVRRSGSGFEALRDVAGQGTGTGGVLNEEGLLKAVAGLYPEVALA
ncbi:MAG: hypothetical protein ABI112_00950 [Terracoccus sp.]